MEPFQTLKNELQTLVSNRPPMINYYAKRLKVINFKSIIVLIVV